jgi:hypothetical protein
LPDVLRRLRISIKADGAALLAAAQRVIGNRLNTAAEGA